MIKFSQKAMQKWNQIDDKVQLHLLENVYCSKCKDAVKIIDFEASIDGNDLILNQKNPFLLNNSMYKKIYDRLNELTT